MESLELKRTDRRWFFAHWNKDVRRVIARGHTGTVTAVLTIVAILIPFFIRWLIQSDTVDSETDAKKYFWVFVLTWIGAILLLAALTAYAVASWLLYRFGPDDYSSVRLEGRPVDHIMCITSVQIFRACQLFLRESRALHAYQEDPSWKLTSMLCSSTNNSDLETRIRGDLEKFERKVLQRQHGMLQRIQSMKRVAAKALDIPIRRLCDHVFQYSPAIHRWLVDEYYNNWDELLSKRGKWGSDLVGLQSLLGRNKAIRQEANRRIRRQRSMIRYRDLHDEINRFASEHSTSGSVRRYAQLMANEARKASTKLKHWNGAKTAPVYEQVIERLSFIYRKQRAYPGFDLNKTCIRILECADPRPDESLGTFLHCLRPKKAASIYEVDNIWKNSDDFQQVLKRLWDLDAIVDDAMKSNRPGLQKNFEAVLHEYVRGETAVVVTHGYSRTVRQLLTNIDGDMYPHSVFIMQSEGQDTQDTRRLFYGLKRREKESPARSIAAGDETVLAPLLEATDRVVVVLGAESFDDSRRVLHPRGIRDRLKKLRKELPKSLVIVVAESYKNQGKGLTTQREFFRDHLDRLDVYDRSQVDIIVSDRVVPNCDCDESGIYPVDWLSTVKSIREGRTPTVEADLPLKREPERPKHRDDA